ncbi:MAG: MCE family protein [Actinobacteria bacterium]|nr:MCE family protein [Actinomycetota bacterium]
MPRQVTTPGRALAMVAFALATVGILLYLWLTFGGPIPLEPKGYRLGVRFPEAATLAEQADVRISGVKVGRVAKLARDGRYTRATLEIDSRFAPLRRDTHAILRQKTLLGETYVELTPGLRSAGTLRDGSTLPAAHVSPTVQLDEIFRTFDPTTREAFRTWMDQQGRALSPHGADLNDALGNLEPFAHDANQVLAVLHQQGADTRELVSDTGAVFDALTARDGQLADLISSSNRVFQTTAARNADLRQTMQILPVFLTEARATTDRLTQFATNANPLITQLRPAARELSPTLIDLHALAPDLKGLFQDLPVLIRASKRGFPALRRVLDNAKPLLGQLDPFLRNLNPVLDWIGLYKHEIAAFFALDSAASQATDFPAGAAAPIHYLRTTNPLSPESLAVYPYRISTNRSNPYVDPLGYRNFPLHVFGTYLCTANPVPTLEPTALIPPAIKSQLPPDFFSLIQQHAFGPGNPAPPCTPQLPLGRYIGQSRLYPHVFRQAHPKAK